MTVTTQMRNEYDIIENEQSKRSYGTRSNKHHQHISARDEMADKREKQHDMAKNEPTKCNYGARQGMTQKTRETNECEQTKHEGLSINHTRQEHKKVTKKTAQKSHSARNQSVFKAENTKKHYG